MAKSADKLWEEFQAFYKEAQEKKSWTAGLTYKTKTDGKLDEKSLLAKLKDLGGKADDEATGAYCSTK